MQEPLTNFFNKTKKKRVTSFNKKNKTIANTSTNSKLSLDEIENKLVSFDLDPKYGPCRGLKRSIRFNLAVKLNLNPPIEILNMILKHDLEKSYYDRFI